MLGLAPVSGAPISAPLWRGVGGLDILLTDTVAVASTLAPLQVLQIVLADTIALMSPVNGGGDTYFEELIEELLLTDIASYVAGDLIDGDVTETVNILDNLDVAKGYLVQLIDALVASDTVAALYGMVLTERVTLAETLTAGQILHVSATENVLLLDSFRQALLATLIDGIGINQGNVVQLALFLLEKLGVSDTLVGAGRFSVDLAAQLIRLQDSLGQFVGGSLSEGLAISSALTGLGQYPGRLTDGIGIQHTWTPQFLLSVKVAENVHLTAVDALRMIYQPKLSEGVEIGGGYLAPDGSFTTWAMNLRNGAVTEYENYEFNSFAAHGNKYLGASATGLYELLGDDDAGEDIVARIRGGYMQFGGTHLSRLKEAYISVRAPNGEVYLKIITADGAEYGYRVDTRSMRNTKIHMGKGQRARYFAYELETTGQDFDLDSLEFVPIVVQRRV